MSGTTFLHFINNSFVASTPERYFDKHPPVDGSLLGSVAEGGAPEVDAAVRAARAALQGPWARMSLAQRTEMLYAVKNVPTEFFEMMTPEGRRAFNYSVRAPKGVIAVICPWNLPLLLMTWEVAPALACGNTVVVKPSEETPATATLLGEAMQEAGIPNGVYNVVHGFGPGSTGEFLTQHADVDAITFTGESATGTAIMKVAAEGIR